MGHANITMTLEYYTHADACSVKAEMERQLLDALCGSLDETGGYPVTGSGKTYGSAPLAVEVGQQPDWILAEGCDGTEGYILAEGLRPDAVEPDEARACMKEMKRCAGETYTIPLYDLGGTSSARFPFKSLTLRRASR